MSSHSRPCYQNLSQYTQNGSNPIMAPIKVETKPQIFTQFTPHNFSQNDYRMHMNMMLMKVGNSNIRKNIYVGYATYSDIICNSEYIDDYDHSASIPNSGSASIPNSGSASIPNSGSASIPNSGSSSYSGSASIPNSGSVLYNINPRNVFAKGFNDVSI